MHQMTVDRVSPTVRSTGRYKFLQIILNALKTDLISPLISLSMTLHRGGLSVDVLNRVNALAPVKHNCRKCETQKNQKKKKRKRRAPIYV